jgi:hypothetical protein
MDNGFKHLLMGAFAHRDGVERLTKTFRAGFFTSHDYKHVTIINAEAALDAWVHDYKYVTIMNAEAALDAWVH